MDWVLHYFKILKEYARDYVLENTGLKVLALLITAVLWLSVASRPVSQIPIANVPIEFPNLNQSPLLAVSKADTLNARVFVEGPRDALDSLRPSQLTVAADMAGVEAGVRVIPLKVDSSRLPPSVKVREIEPRSVRVTVESVLSKEVPIKPRFEGRPGTGYEMTGWKITPTTVRIGGAENQIRDVSEASTETVNLNDRTQTFSTRVAIDTGSPNISISEQTPNTVMLQVILGEVQKERTIDRVPVTLLNSPRGARAIPAYERVTLLGAQSIIDSIVADDIVVVVDYQNGAGGHRFAPQVSVAPEFADRVSVKLYEPKRVVVR